MEETKKPRMRVYMQVLHQTLAGETWIKKFFVEMPEDLLGNVELNEPSQ